MFWTGVVRMDLIISHYLWTVENNYRVPNFMNSIASVTNFINESWIKLLKWKDPYHFRLEDSPLIDKTERYSIISLSYRFGISVVVVVLTIGVCFEQWASILLAIFYTILVVSFWSYNHSSYRFDQP